LIEYQKEHGTSPDIFYLNGVIKMCEGSSEQAKKMFQDGMKQDPDNKKCLIALKKAKKCENLKE
jgi:DnaJ family protein C protein 7